MTNAELESKVRELMEGIGLLPPDHFVFDGNFHTCGVQGSPKSVAGRYKVYADDMPTVLVRNWKTGDCVTWSAKRKADMTPEERKLYNKRIAEERKQAEAEQKAKYARAAKKARYLWPKFMPAKEDNPYLQRKMLPPGPFRQTRSGTLALPVLDCQGQMMTLQFITREGEKRFMAEGDTAGGRFPIPSQDGQDTGPLLIGEGAATVGSTCLATDLAGEIAFTCGNLPRVARDARARWPEREIVILEDNDQKTEAEQGINPGFEASLKAAQEAGARIAHCPAKKGLSRDFSDMYCEEGAEAVRKAVAQALEAANVKDTWASNLAYMERKKGQRRMTKKTQRKLEDKAQAQGQGNQEEDAAHKLPFGFYYAMDGSLKFAVRNSKGEVIDHIDICRHVEVIGRTSGAAKWGYVLQWSDPEEKAKQLAIPSKLFARNNTDLFELLAEEGLEIIGSQEQKLFKKFVCGFGDNLPIIRNVDRVGWYDGSFVLPDTTIGAGADTRKVILQAGDSGLLDLYRTGGTLEGWQKMAALCEGNTRLIFGLSHSFSGPLLYFVPKVAGTIFSFCGPSTTGKTTALDVAASVWGHPEKQKRTWRLTSNGLESICTLYNDSVLYLDEMGEAEADDLQAIAYMFAGGTGKTRARRDGGAKNLQSWRSVALSTGEVSFKTKLLEAGLKTYAGQMVRFVDIPIASGHMSFWHDLPSAKALAEELSRRSMLDFGLAGRAFLEKLVQDLETVRNELPGMVKQVEGALCPMEADAQVLRVAQRFALVCVAGQLAQGYGILPPSLEVFGAVQSCFNDWLAARGSLRSMEEQNMLRTIRRFIEQYGNSRFQDESSPQRPCNSRVGFVRKNDAGKNEYYFFPETFCAEVAKGFEPAHVIRVLEAAGWLKRDSDRPTCRVTFEGTRQPFYCVRLPEEDGGANE